MKTTRRSFLKSTAAVVPVAFTAASYTRILGANDRINVGVMGLGGRGQGLTQTFAAAQDVLVTDLCEADPRRADETNAKLKEMDVDNARVHSDIRRMLDTSACDALVIATPDHWHAPAAMLALAAGRHVYLEKPVSHNPAEGEMLVSSQQKHGHVVQVGNQQRSAAETIDLMRRVHAGELGEVYRIYTWYANNRGTIGNGKMMAPPDWLDWEQWQGPAPRRDYQDNLVHYNWHWFWHWGTGETCNNAMHELDLARWALRADYPDAVRVNGSRQFYTDDDWEMYDTIVAEFDFGGVEVVWEGHSCNNVPAWNKGRGAMIYGTKGSAIVDRNGYTIRNPDGEIVQQASAAAASETTDVRGGGMLDHLHIANFLGVVRGDQAQQHSPVLEGHKSTLLCHLANIAYREGRELEIDPATGRLSNGIGQQFWSREYEPGWEPLV